MSARIESPWAKVPIDLLQHPGVTLADVQVYVHIDYAAGKRGYWDGTQREIAEATGVTDRTVRTAITRLEQFDYITTQRLGFANRTVLRYWVLARSRPLEEAFHDAAEPVEAVADETPEIPIRSAERPEEDFRSLGSEFPLLLLLTKTYTQIRERERSRARTASCHRSRRQPRSTSGLECGTTSAEARTRRETQRSASSSSAKARLARTLTPPSPRQRHAGSRPCVGVARSCSRASRGRSRDGRPDMTEELRRQALDASELYAAQARERGREVPREVVERMAEAEYRRLLGLAERPTYSPSMPQQSPASDRLGEGGMMSAGSLAVIARGMQVTPDMLHGRMRRFFDRPVEEREALLAEARAERFTCRSCQDSGRVWLSRADECFEPGRVAGMNRAQGAVVSIADRAQVLVWCSDCPPALQRARQLRGALSVDDVTECRFDTFDAYSPSLRNMRDQARRWAERVERRPLLLMVGPAGIGKSHLAKAAALQLAESGYSVEVATADGLLSRIKQTFDRGDRSQASTADVMHEIAAAGVLVVDDLGAEYATAWGASTLEALIFARYESRSLTVITGNKDLAALAEHQGDPHLRLFDRVGDVRRTVYVEADAESWRANGGRPARYTVGGAR